MPSKLPDSRSIQSLAQACAEQTSRQHTPTRERDPCYELFHRAFASSSDEQAWQVILEQYRRLVWHWLGQYASPDTVQEVFVRVWKTQQNATSSFAARFPNTGAVMGYLKRCAYTVGIEVGRKAERRQGTMERLRNVTPVESLLMRSRSDRGHSDFHWKQLLLSKLQDEKEYAVLEGTYYYDLPPRDIQAMRPDLFPDIRVVYRVKERILTRLRRDPELCGWWSDDPE